MPRARVPQPRRIVRTPGEDAALVPDELRTVNRSLVLQRRAQRLARPRIPESRRVVEAPGKDAALVPAELRAKNRALVRDHPEQPRRLYAAHVQQQCLLELRRQPDRLGRSVERSQPFAALLREAALVPVVAGLLFLAFPLGLHR